MESKGLKRVIFVLAIPLLGAWLITFAEFGEVWPFSTNPTAEGSETPWRLFRKTFLGLAIVAFTIVSLPEVLGWDTRQRRLNSYSNSGTKDG
ncbi:hypothetical protein GS636_18760 [Ruegeria sp. HKCCD4884]|uniref:hypothetical protein n=1 Tax=Ruegeria sp. HKCCD4884 TaxID=2683022 RepID=UPI0014911DB6|nr:hypothetical protein [Ruegeria sp. HKCCD4884]NOD94840.1 hypothetical protein [Ruegeria sp. HKCCD4884]